MKCSSCKSEISSNVYFCWHCGEKTSSLSLRNQELVQTYADKMRQVVSSVGTAEHIKITWDMTVEKYVYQMEQLKTVLSQPEFNQQDENRLLSKINAFIERCRTPEFHIAFVGTIKAGKSTLINALLNRNLASTSVTPETAVLTKFRHCSNCNYVRVKFYSKYDWEQLWDSISGNADVFLQEYKMLNGDAVKDEWIGHSEIRTETTDEELEDVIERWTSSKRVEHYFVKEVEVGLQNFDVPEEVVFVDTPGLDDAVKYRSDVTRNYIDRANAVFACVRSDALTGPELSTLYRIFSNTSYNPEKVYVLGTQWDSLNNPEEDWEKQKKEWMKYLSGKSCYGSAEIAGRNILHVAAFVQNLCREYGNLSRPEMRTLLSVAMKLFDDIMTIDDVEEHLADLMEKSNISEVHRKIKHDIVAKYSEYLMRDINQSFLDLRSEIKGYFTEVKETNQKILETSTKSIDEIRKEYESSKEELEVIQDYRTQLEAALSAVKEQTKERVNALCKQLQEMAKR